MTTWLYLSIALISITCTSALPARQGEGEPKTNEDNRLLFEAKEESNAQNQDSGQKDAELLRLAAEQNISRSAPESHGEIGSLAGEQVAHGADGDTHGGSVETKPIKHTNTGALSDDFVHNMMHDGKEDHEEEDEQIRKGRPADIRDVSRMEFDEELLKGVDKEGLKDPYEGEPRFEDQKHGPLDPSQDLHGVLMHGDTEAGKDHGHEDKVKDERPASEASVKIEQVGQAGDATQVKQIPNAPPKTKNTEELLHGEGEDHAHEQAPKKTQKVDGLPDRVLTETFMHDLMHGAPGEHGHDDVELKKSKVVRPRDLLNLGLDKDILKGLDLEKMIREDMEDYNRYISEKGGDEDSPWNIFNSFQFRYFKYGENIDDISSRQPPQEEWDESMITPPVEHKGEDNIEHMMERFGDDSIGERPTP